MTIYGPRDKLWTQRQIGDLQTNHRHKDKLWTYPLNRLLCRPPSATVIIVTVAT